jgi:streptogramin lyase
MAGAWAQPLPVHFTSYSTANGLPDNSVQSILQDSRGFMWFGTREGLGRFDGTGFKNFFEGRDSTAMHGNNVNQLLEYKPGHLVFNSTGGVTCLNTITQQFYYPALRKGKPAVWLHTGPRGSFFMTRTDTCFVINNRLEITDTLVPPLQYKNSALTAYVLDSHTWLLGSEKEYYLYNPATRRFTSFISPAQMPVKQPFFTFH